MAGVLATAAEAHAAAAAAAEPHEHGGTLDERLARWVRVRLKLRVRTRANVDRVSAKLSVGPATAEEMMREANVPVAAAGGEGRPTEKDEGGGGGGGLDTQDGTYRRS